MFYGTVSFIRDQLQRDFNIKINIHFLTLFEEFQIIFHVLNAFLEYFFSRWIIQSTDNFFLITVSIVFKIRYTLILLNILYN